MLSVKLVWKIVDYLVWKIWTTAEYCWYSNFTESKKVCNLISFFCKANILLFCYILFNADDELNGFYAEFEEEVLAEDGEVEEYFGYDLPAVWVDFKLWFIDFTVNIIHQAVFFRVFCYLIWCTDAIVINNRCTRGRTNYPPVMPQCSLQIRTTSISYYLQYKLYYQYNSFADYATQGYNT